MVSAPHRATLESCQNFMFSILLRLSPDARCFSPHERRPSPSVGVPCAPAFPRGRAGGSALLLRGSHCLTLSMLGVLGSASRPSRSWGVWPSMVGRDHPGLPRPPPGRNLPACLALLAHATAHVLPGEGLMHERHLAELAGTSSGRHCRASRCTCSRTLSMPLEFHRPSAPSASWACSAEEAAAVQPLALPYSAPSWLNGFFFWALIFRSRTRVFGIFMPWLSEADLLLP